MILLSRRSLLAIAAVVDIALHARPAPAAAKLLAARHNLPPRSVFHPMTPQSTNRYAAANLP